MKIDFFSDTHGLHDQLKFDGGDMLVFCGDMCKRGTLPEIESFAFFIKNLNYKHKIVIAGNHDFALENDLKYKAQSLIKDSGAIYLNDSGIEIMGLKFWGSPVQPTFYDWAFNRKRGDDIKKHWDLIPNGVDILVIHGPPLGILDCVQSGEHVGCKDLLERIQQLNPKPKIVAFGHIHEAYGILKQDEITFINACNLDLQYKVSNPIISLEIPHSI